MTKAEVDLGIGVIKYTFERLPSDERIRLIEELKEEAWTNKLDTAAHRMRIRIKQAKVSVKDIDRICEEVKQEYNEKHRRH